jgi:hypothetical protein
MAQSKSRGKARGAARKRAAPSSKLANALGAAAWAEADTALAEALAEFEAWQAGDAAASSFVGQALRRAARKRGLITIGVADEIEIYDPARHMFIKSVARAPKSVRIVSPGIGRAGEVLVKARVAPVRRRKQ